MKTILFFNLISSVLLAYCNSCSSDANDDTADEIVDNALVVNVAPSNFTANNVSITTVPCTLSDGTETDCYQIVTSSTPSDHEMGPWCPDNIVDDAVAGEIWIEGGEVYDEDGAFIENMATFFNDTNWQMYDDYDTTYVTDTDIEDLNGRNYRI